MGLFCGRVHGCSFAEKTGIWMRSRTSRQGQAEMRMKM
jgi:hypothetical protein